MEMKKEKYEELLLRFALELKQTGVTDNIIDLIQSQYNRAPNVASVSAKEETSKFVYRHNGFSIEAKQTVEIVIKSCK